MTEQQMRDEEDKKALSLREFQEAVGHLIFWGIVAGVVLSVIILLDDFLIPLIGVIKEWLNG